MDGLACGPADHFAGEQVQYDGQVEPALPGPDIRDVSDPDTVGLRNVKIALDEVRDQLRCLATCDVTSGPVTAFRSHTVLFHQPRNTMFATRFTGLSKIEKDAWRAVYTLALFERRSDQAEQAPVFASPIRDWLAEPRVVAARRNIQQAAHRLNAVLILVGFDELVLSPNGAGLGFLGHLPPPAFPSPSSQCP